MTFVVLLVAMPGTVLRLTAGDGPWNWSRAKYDLLDGALDDRSTTFSSQQCSSREVLGSLWRMQPSAEVAQGQASFSFKHPSADLEPRQARVGSKTKLKHLAPLTLALTTFEAAGVGAQVWEAAIAMTLFLSSDRAPALPEQYRVLELGAGVGLPSFVMARSSAATRVTLTDSRPAVLELGRRNSEGLRAAHVADGTPFAAVDVQALDWGEPQPNETGYSVRAPSEPYDLVIGSDVCYEETAVQGLASIILELAAPVTIIAGPTTRPSMQLLASHCAHMPGVHVETLKLTLVSSDASDDKATAEEGERDERMRSGGVHLVLVIRQQPAVP